MATWQSATTVIEAVDIHKSYRRGATMTCVLRGVDLLVRRGECVFLVGPSGSGKSTLLSILGCILTPDRGHVRLLGHDLGRVSNRERTWLRRELIGFVFQRFQLIRGLTAFDNIKVPLLLRGTGEREARRRVEQLLDAVGISAQAQLRPSQLSAGQCQRVSLARALAADPELIFADEPTAALDEQTGHQMIHLLHRLIKAQGKTAIVVTHDQRIFRYADRILVMHQGRIENARPAEAIQPVPTQTTCAE